MHTFNNQQVHKSNLLNYVRIYNKACNFNSHRVQGYMYNDQKKNIGFFFLLIKKIALFVFIFFLSNIDRRIILACLHYFN
jgi:hypothetical protein